MDKMAWTHGAPLLYQSCFIHASTKVSSILGTYHVIYSILITKQQKI